MLSTFDQIDNIVLYNGIFGFFCGSFANQTMILLLTQVCICDYASGGLGLEAALNQFYADLKGYCQSRSLQLHMSGLTRTLIGYTNSSHFPTGFLGISWC